MVERDRDGGMKEKDKQQIYRDNKERHTRVLRQQIRGEKGKRQTK